MVMRKERPLGEEEHHRSKGANNSLGPWRKQKREDMVQGIKQKASRTSE
jgi:hypothetical protein